MRGEGDLKDLMEAVEPRIEGEARNPLYYIETQIHGGLGMDDVEMLLVESASAGRRLREVLDAAGYRHIEVRAAPQHKQLQRILLRERRSMKTLGPEDVELLGDEYIEALVENAARILERGRWPTWGPDRWAPEVRRWRDEFRTARSFLYSTDIEEQREFLKDYYRAMRREDGLPPDLRAGYDPDGVGWAADVADRRLLESYPERMPGEPAALPGAPARVAAPAGPQVSDRVAALDLDGAYERGLERRLARIREEHAAERLAGPAPTGDDYRRVLDEAWGGDPTEHLQRALAPDRTALYTAVDADALDEILRGDGELKNALQSGRSSFVRGGKRGARRRLENSEVDHFGVDRDTILENPAEGAHYAILAGRGTMDHGELVGKRYGQYYLRISNRRRADATVMIGDSLNIAAQDALAPAVPLNRLSRRLVDDSVRERVDDGRMRFAAADSERAVEARQRLVNGEGDWRDVLRSASHDAEYLEAQIFGRVGIEDIEAIVVESRKEARRLARVLEARGITHIKIEPAVSHTRLKQIWEGRGRDAFRARMALDYEDIDRMGDAWVHRLVDGEPMEVFHPDTEEVWPPSLQAFRTRLVRQADSGELEFPDIATKRAYLREWYRLLAHDEFGGMPADIRAARAAGKADDFSLSDVVDQRLLREYPDELPSDPPGDAIFEPAPHIRVATVDTPVSEAVERLDLDAQFRRNLEDFVDEHADYDLEMTVERLENALTAAWSDVSTAQIREALDGEHTAVWIAIKGDDTFQEILESGRYKAFAESGRTGGADAIERRGAAYRTRRVEDAVLGTGSVRHGDDATPVVYAVISGKSAMNTPTMVNTTYGGSFLRLKPEWRGRATITGGDSLAYNPSRRDPLTMFETYSMRAPAVPLEAPDRRLLHVSLYYSPDDGLLEEIGDAAARARLAAGSASHEDLRKALAGDNTYIEAQLHGGVPVEAFEAGAGQLDLGRQEVPRPDRPPRRRYDYRAAYGTPAAEGDPRRQSDG